MDAGLAAIEEPRNLALDGEGLAGAVAAVQDCQFPVRLGEDCRHELVAVHHDGCIHIDGIEVAFPMVKGVACRGRTEEPHYLTVGIAGDARRRVGGPLSIDYNGQSPVDFPEDGRDATVVIHGYTDSGAARIVNPFQVALPVIESPAGLRDGPDEGKPTVLVVMHAGRRIRRPRTGHSDIQCPIPFRLAFALAFTRIGVDRRERSHLFDHKREFRCISMRRADAHQEQCQWQRQLREELHLHFKDSFTSVVQRH